MPLPPLGAWPLPALDGFGTARTDADALRAHGEFAMQPLAWYVQRLGAMSTGEVVWRLHAMLRDTADRCLLSHRQKHARGWESAGRGALTEPGFRVSDVVPGEWLAGSPREQAWCARLVARADLVAKHRLSLFDLHDHFLGDPIDWNRDHKSGKSAPRIFAPRIDYRDFRVTGDCKFVWEPNRHHQLVVLGRAYRATGDPRFAAAVVEQLESWIAQCPYGLGMNWRSPLELGIRLINWVWAVDLIRDSGWITDDFRACLAGVVYRHVWEIARKYSRGSSANNHLVGEAAGVFIATAYFRALPHADRWRAQSRTILQEQILAQTYADGGTREQALGYHLFVLDLFLLAGLVGRCIGDRFSTEYWARLERMFAFAGALTEGGWVPMFGDCDDGYVLDLGCAGADASARRSVAAAIYQRADFRARAGEFSEPARWLLGQGAARHDALPTSCDSAPIPSRAFRDSGLYLLQSGGPEMSDRLSVCFDCGQLGLPPLAAHGHADALSFTLRAFGEDILVDPGTYDYFSFATWRDYFRSTRAHNTIVVDGLDQSEMRGPFLWGRHAKSRCMSWEPTACGGRVMAEHEGYLRLSDPVRHRRTLALDGRACRLTVTDELSAGDAHEIEVYFHIAEGCTVERAAPQTLVLHAKAGQVTMRLDPRLTVDTLVGSTDPIGGWVSRGYHQKSPTTTVVGRCEFTGALCLTCTFDVYSSQRPSGSRGARAVLSETARRND
jgi:hypothetical protein